MNDPTQPKLSISVGNNSVPLIVDEFYSPSAQSIKLASQDGRIKLTVPREMYPSIPFERGDMVIVFISMARVSVEAPIIERPALILPRVN